MKYITALITGLILAAPSVHSQSINVTTAGVSIVTTAPAQKLDVVGNVAASGNVTVGGSLTVSGTISRVSHGVRPLIVDLTPCA